MNTKYTVNHVSRLGYFNKEVLEKFWGGKKYLTLLELLTLHNRFPHDINIRDVIELAARIDLPIHVKGLWRVAVITQALDALIGYGLDHLAGWHSRWSFGKDHSQATAINAYKDLYKTAYGHDPASVPEPELLPCLRMKGSDYNQSKLLPGLYVAHAATRPLDGDFRGVLYDLSEANIATHMHLNRDFYYDDMIVPGLHEAYLNSLIDAIEFNTVLYGQGDTGNVVPHDATTINIYQDVPDMWCARLLDDEGRELDWERLGWGGTVPHLQSAALHALNLWGGQFKFKIDLPETTLSGMAVAIRPMLEQRGLEFEDPDSGIIRLCWNVPNPDTAKVYGPGKIAQHYIVALIDPEYQIVENYLIHQSLDRELNYFDVEQGRTHSREGQGGLNVVVLGEDCSVSVGFESSTEDLPVLGYSLLLIPVMPGPTAGSWIRPLEKDIVDIAWVKKYLNSDYHKANMILFDDPEPEAETQPNPKPENHPGADIIKRTFRHPEEF